LDNSRFQANDGEVYWVGPCPGEGLFLFSEGCHFVAIFQKHPFDQFTAISFIMKYE
jgi:hypothetical protein